jgi:hypothetical protein
MTPPSSGRHRDQVPFPERGAAASLDPGDPSGLHSERPLLRIVRGSPTDEELAALTVVVAALSQRRARRRLPPVGGWASYADRCRPSLRPGPGGWRASGRFT